MNQWDKNCKEGKNRIRVLIPRETSCLGNQSSIKQAALGEGMKEKLMVLKVGRATLWGLRVKHSWSKSRLLLMCYDLR